MVNAFRTRDDCSRDNVAVNFRGSTSLGFSRPFGMRGFWIRWESDNHHHVGRMVGRVLCEGTEYAEVLRFTQDLRSAHVFWVDPNTVRASWSTTPSHFMEFMCCAWTDSYEPLVRANRGFLPQESIPEPDQPAHATTTTFAPRTRRGTELRVIGVIRAIIFWAVFGTENGVARNIFDDYDRAVQLNKRLNAALTELRRVMAGRGYDVENVRYLAALDECRSFIFGSTPSDKPDPYGDPTKRNRLLSEAAIALETLSQLTTGDEL